jgi:biopolymer transport protein ExbB/TolQ
MPDYFDLYVAFGLLFVVIVVFIASRVGILPKKSIPILLGALAGVLGLRLLKKWQGRALDGQIKELQDRIAKRDVDLQALEAQSEVSHQELAAARAALDQQLAAAQKQSLALEAADKAEKERIARLSTDATIDEFQKMMERRANAVATPATATGGGT